MELLKRLFRGKKDSQKYIGSWLGHTFYVIDPVHDLAYNRYLNFIKVGQEIQAYMSPLGKLTSIIDLIGDANNKRDKDKISLLVETFRVMIQNNDKLLDFELFEYVCQFILVDDEKVKEKNPEKYRDIKRKVWNGSDEARFFFIQFAFKSREILINSSEVTNPEEVLKTQNLRAKFVNGTLSSMRTKEG